MEGAGPQALPHMGDVAADPHRGQAIGHCAMRIDRRGLWGWAHPLNAGGQAQSLPRRASVAIRSPVRQAMACMVSDGLTPPTVQKTEPSQIHRLRMSQERQSASTTL